VISATPRWRDAQASQAFTAVPASEVDPTADVLSALLGGLPLPHGADQSPPAPARLLNLTALANRLVAPPRQPLEIDGGGAFTEALEETEGVYDQFPEQFHNIAHALRVRRTAPGAKIRLTDLLADADELFAHRDAAVVTDLAALVGSLETARRRLRLLLALDAMMLWRPDGRADTHDDWWAVDDGSRAVLPDIEIPDLLVHQRGKVDDRS
jgi:hypothetical protein